MTLDLVLSSFVGLAELQVARTSKNGQATGLIWAESRPSEAGRNAIVFQSLNANAKTEEVLPATATKTYNARTRVHEYGGSCIAAVGHSEIVFSHIDGPVFSTKRSSDGTWSEPKQVSPPSDVHRFADFDTHPNQSSLVLAVLEDHTVDTPADVVNTLVAFDTAAKEPKLHTVASGADFYSNGRWSPSGKYVSWIQWMHPDMCWEGSELWVAKVSTSADGSVKVADAKKIAGEGKGKESVSQARWALEEDKLVFLSDRTGFNELYAWSEDKEVELVLEQPSGSDVGRECAVKVSEATADHAGCHSTRMAIRQLYACSFVRFEMALARC